MFTKAILTAVAVSAATTTVQANERPEWVTSQTPAATAQVPASSVLSSKDLSRAGYAPGDLITVTTLKNGTAIKEMSSSGNR